MSDDTDEGMWKTFEIEVNVHEDASSCEDMLEFLQMEGFDVRKVESGDPLEAPEGHDIAWGDA